MSAPRKFDEPCLMNHVLGTRDHADGLHAGQPARNSYPRNVNDVTS